MINLVLKTAVIYFVIVFAMRIMGKRQLSQLQPYQLVIALLIAEVTATPLDTPGIPIFYGLVPAATLILLYHLVSRLSLKSIKLRKIFEGNSCIVINKGKLCREELHALGYNLSDLLEQVRLGGYEDISQIDYAILETGGSLSVFPKSDYSPVTLKDLNLKNTNDILCTPLVMDGDFVAKNAVTLNLTRDKLENILAEKNIKSIKNVFYCSLQKDGSLHLQTQKGECLKLKIPKL